MLPRSNKFDLAVRDSHSIATLCEILDARTNQLLSTLDIIDGSITYGTSSARRYAYVNLGDPNGIFTPGNYKELLQPLGRMMRLFRGIRYPDGTSELLPCGVYDISLFRVDDSGDGFTCRVDGYDRSRKLTRAALTDDYSIAAGTNIGTAIQMLLNHVLVGSSIQINYDFSSTVYTTPLVNYQAGADPWAGAFALAQSIGCDLYFSVDGYCTMRPILDPRQVIPVWTFDDTRDQISMADAQMYQDDPVNHYVVFGEATDSAPAVRGEAYDNDPSSPTYVFGPYGRNTNVSTSSVVTTVAQANAMAAGLLAKTSAAVQQVDMDIVPHPAFDVNDVIRVRRPRISLDSHFAITQVVIPMIANRASNLSTLEVAKIS
jgi:hypothetical protein